MFKAVRRLLKKPNAVVIQCRNNTTTSNNVIQDVEPPDIYNPKLLKVAIIGMPNSGKSTLINSLMDRKVCAASAKVHTTRCKARAIFTQDDTQIVFIDTPGMVNDREHKKFNLEKTFIRDSKTVSRQADIIGVVHDAHDCYNREKLDIKIIKLLEYCDRRPSFLVLNKVDLLKSKRKLLDLTRVLTDNCLNGKPIYGNKPIKDSENKGWPNFQEIFMISALTGDGVEDIRNYLIRSAKPGEWLFSDEVWTDQSADEIIIRTVQAKLLDFMPQEIPYSLNPVLEYLNVADDGVMTVGLTVECPKERIAKLVSGNSDGKIRQIIAGVQKDLQEAFQTHVRLNMAVNYPPSTT